MELYHLHLNVVDIAASEAFYGRYFGFRRHFPGASEVFLKNDRGILLALAPVATPDELRVPEWFHLGFQGTDATEVHELLARMTADGVPIVEPWTEFPSGTVKFHCIDPSGYRVEVRWDVVR